ncbi:hypothetical protein BVRB_1g019920 [Beta vulgaris subsp. vulgaris]|nr:hypothetical protein BVRB_1g019920 [Beta vulgaris subsp. vulgaris]
MENLSLEITNKALALQVNLEKRGIFILGKCQLCHDFNETEEHLFRNCNIASRVWMRSSLGIQTMGSEYIPMQDWIPNFLSKFWKEDGKDSDRSLWFCAILWSIWLHQNHVAFRGTNPNPYHVLRMAEDLAREEIQRCEDLKKTVSKSEQAGSVSRAEIKFSHGTPQGRQCVISVDGAWKRVRKKTSIAAGIGWIAKEGEEVIFSGNDIVKANSALQCEGLAVVRALAEAHKRRIENIKVLTDSESLINSLNQNLFPLQLFNICQDIRKYCENFRRQRTHFPHRPPRNLPYKHLAPLQPVPTLICSETLPPESPPPHSPPLHPLPATITTANAFATLAEFQISCDEGFCLQPPAADLPSPGLLEQATDPIPDDDIDEAFLQALGVIHHNPHLSFDADMIDQFSPVVGSPSSAGLQSPRDNTKRRKREDDPSPASSP